MIRAVKGVRTPLCSLVYGRGLRSVLLGLIPRTSHTHNTHTHTGVPGLAPPLSHQGPNTPNHPRVSLPCTAHTAHAHTGVPGLTPPSAARGQTLPITPGFPSPAPYTPHTHTRTQGPRDTLPPSAANGKTTSDHPRVSLPCTVHPVRPRTRLRHSCPTSSGLQPPNSPPLGPPPSPWARSLPGPSWPLPSSAWSSQHARPQGQLSQHTPRGTGTLPGPCPSSRASCAAPQGTFHTPALVLPARLTDTALQAQPQGSTGTPRNQPQPPRRSSPPLLRSRGVALVCRQSKDDLALFFLQLDRETREQRDRSVCPHGRNLVAVSRLRGAKIPPQVRTCCTSAASCPVTCGYATT